MKMKAIARMALTLLALLCVYVLLMTLAYAFPNRWIEFNVNASLDVYKTEGYYPQYFFGYPYGQLDSMTDKTMYQLLLKGDGNTLTEAMVPTYARYWHGYAVLLRPLSIVFNVINLRYFNMLWMMGLFCLSFYLAAKRLGLPAAFAYAGGLLAAFIVIAPFCLQFTTVFALTMLASCVLLSRWKRLQSSLPMVFMVIGSLTHFFDFLTFPVLTLGYPLLLVLLMRQKGERTFHSELVVLLQTSLAWCVGYGVTLLGKGAAGTLLTGNNVFADIFDNVAIRISGSISENFKEPLSAWSACRYNLETFFHARTLLAFAGAIVFLAFTALCWHKRDRGWLASLPILGVALYPYVWYSVLQNHSNIHFFFTSKAQAVTIFAVCAYLIAVVDWSRAWRRRSSIRQ